MRLNECEQVKETLEKHLGINLTVVDGAELFLSRLKDVHEPEKKRKIIGGTCKPLPFLSLPLVPDLRELATRGRSGDLELIFAILAEKSSTSSSRKPSALRRRLRIRPTPGRLRGSCREL